MYAEMGYASGDTETVTITYGATSPAKLFNIFVQQIECTNPSRAPTDCLTYFTGTAGTLISYNWAGAQYIEGMYSKYCVRTERGYCSINWTPTSGTTIDSFGLFASAIYTSAIAIATAFSAAATCLQTGGIGIMIPKTSNDGITALPVIAAIPALDPFPDAFCGGVFGFEGDASTRTLTSVQMPFGLYAISTPAGTMDPAAPSSGFSMDYQQVACST